MSAAVEHKTARPSNKRTIVAIAGCVMGVGLILFGFRTVTNQAKQETLADSKVPAAKSQKPVRAWNVALGDVVVLAEELGFEVKGPTGSKSEQNKIQARIESQLQGLREFYREESEKNPTLMGGVMLQLTIAPSGEVSQVKELGSRIADAEFTKAVIAQVSQWWFQDLVSEPVMINCPLLFVREGMDITTVVQWEKALGPLADKPFVARTQPQPAQEAKTPEPVKTVARRAQPPSAPAPRLLSSAAGRSAGTIYQLKYVTTVRTDPNFGAPSVAKFPAGAKVSLIRRRGDWLEVRSADVGLSGFIRKEFVTPIEMTRQ